MCCLCTCVCMSLPLWRRESIPSLRVSAPVFLTSCQQSPFLYWFLFGDCGLWGRTESDTTEVTEQQQLLYSGFPGGSDNKEFICNVGDLGAITGWGRSPGRGHGTPLQYSCLENPHGQRSLVDYSPWSREESDTTEQLSTAQHSCCIHTWLRHLNCPQVKKSLTDVAILLPLQCPVALESSGCSHL